MQWIQWILRFFRIIMLDKKLDNVTGVLLAEIHLEYLHFSNHRLFCWTISTVLSFSELAITPL